MLWKAKRKKKEKIRGSKKKKILSKKRGALNSALFLLKWIIIKLKIGKNTNNKKKGELA